MNLWYNRGNDLKRSDVISIPRMSHKGKLMTDLSIPPLQKCTKCGEEKPHTREFFKLNNRTKTGLSNLCRECNRADARAYHHSPKHHNHILEYMRQRAVDHKDHVRALNKKARDKYRAKPEVQERRKQYGREYVKRPEVKKRYKENAKKPSTVLKRQQYSRSPKGRLILKTTTARRRARIKELPVNYTTQDYIRMMEYWGHSCCVCGQKASFWHTIAQEHWIAISDPRSDNPGTVSWNMIPMCHAIKGSNGQAGCNNSKAAKDPVKWLISVYGKRKAVQIVKRIEAYFEWVKSQ